MCQKTIRVAAHRLMIAPQKIDTQSVKTQTWYRLTTIETSIDEIENGYRYAELWKA